jgi:transporter family protein
MWVLYALLSAVFAALVTIFAKVGMKDVDTDLATAIRTIVILVLAWAFAFFKGGTATMGSLTKANWIFIVLSGVCTGLSWICYFKALQLGNVTQVAPIDKLSLALALILAVVFLKEHMGVKEIVGAGLIIAGTLVLVLGKTS